MNLIVLLKEKFLYGERIVVCKFRNFLLVCLKNITRQISCNDRLLFREIWAMLEWIGYLFEGFDDGLWGFFIFTFDFCHDFLVEFILVLLWLLSDEELVFNWLKFIFEELFELKRIVFDFFFEDGDFFVKVFQVLTELGVDLLDLSGVCLRLWWWLRWLIRGGFWHCLTVLRWFCLNPFGLVLLIYSFSFIQLVSFIWEFD